MTDRRMAEALAAVRERGGDPCPADFAAGWEAAVSAGARHLVDPPPESLSSSERLGWKMAALFGAKWDGWDASLPPAGAAGAAGLCGGVYYSSPEEHEQSCNNPGCRG